MSESVGEVFVRVRPDAANFKGEASGPIVAAGNALGKAFLAAFAIGGAAKTIESVVHAATEHQAAFALLDQTTKDAGASNTLFGQSLETLLEKEARLKGFTDEELASSFTRLVSATRNSATAFKDLGLAEDVARARHISVEQAALAVSKAEQGVSTALQRLGIVVPKVTTAVDDLKAAHENAVIAGAKFTDGQKAEYAQALLTAAVQDKAATRVKDLAALQQRFGGDAAVFAQTASGQFARLQADFHQFEVTVGTGVLSSLAGAAEGLGSFFTEASQSERVRADIDHLTGDIRTGFNDIRDVAETVAPVLLTVATGAKDVVSAVGGPEILTAIAAYKAFGVVQSGIAASQAFYARAVAAGRGETVADTNAQKQHAAAVVANSAALTGQADSATAAETRYTTSLAATTTAITTQTAALESLATAFAAAGTAATEGGAASTLRLGTGVQTGTTVAATGTEVAVTDASAAATVGLTTETEGLTAALAALDAARAAEIAASARSTVAIDAEAAALARLVEADTAAAVAAVSAGLATQKSAVYFGEAATAATVAAAAEERAAVAAAEASAASGGFLTGAGKLGFAAIGGSAGAAAIGVGLLAAGIYKLVTAENVATAATHGLETAANNLATASHTEVIDKLTLAQDKLNLRRDQAALSTSKAAHSSAEYQQLLLNVANDSQSVADAQRALGIDVTTTAGAFDKQKQKVQALIDASQTLANSDRARLRGPATAGDQQKEQTDATRLFVAGIQQTIAAEQNLSPLQEHNLQLLEQFAEVFGKVPPTKTWNLILNNKDATLSLQNLVREVDGLPPLTAAAAAAAGEAVSDNFNAAVLAGAKQFTLGPAVSQEFANVPSQAGPAAADAGSTLGVIFAGALAAAASTGVEAAAKAAQAIQVEADAQAKFEAAAKPLRAGIVSDKNDLAQLATEMADAVTQGAQTLASAVQQAKVNLNTIGQDLANSLQQFIQKPLDDQQAKISAAQNRLSIVGDKITLQHLRGEVLLPGGKTLSQDPTKAIAQLEQLEKTSKSPALAQFIQTYQAAALQEQSDQLATKQAVAQAIEKRASTRLADLTDLFNTGRISQAALERDVTALLRKQGLTEKTAQSRGAAFADTLAGQLTGLDQQATAIRTGPQQTGSGLIPSIVRPIDTLNQTQKTLAGIASQERTKQLDESKKQTALLQKINGAQAAAKATDSLGHNSGAKTKRAVELVGTGG